MINSNGLPILQTNTSGNGSSPIQLKGGSGSAVNHAFTNSYYAKDTNGSGGNDYNSTNCGDTQMNQSYGNNGAGCSENIFADYMTSQTFRNSGVTFPLNGDTLYFGVGEQSGGHIWNSMSSSGMSPVAPDQAPVKTVSSLSPLDGSLETNSFTCDTGKTCLWYW